MSAAKHTTEAGWKPHADGDEIGYYVSVFGPPITPDAADELICKIPHDYSIAGKAQAEKRATLIAAAPDLYEALEAICDMQAKRYGDGMRTHMALIELVEQARAVLAKARGEA